MWRRHCDEKRKTNNSNNKSRPTAVNLQKEVIRRGSHNSHCCSSHRDTSTFDHGDNSNNYMLLWPVVAVAMID